MKEEYLTDMMQFYIIELKKLKKKKPKELDELEKWLLIIGGDEEMMKKCKEEKGEIREAIEQLEVMSADEKERAEYEAREKAIITYGMDLYASREKGRTEGEKIGVVKGQEIGKKEAKMEMAKKLLKEKMPIEFIKKVTNLTQEEIENL